jgi:hypothetical protein
MLGRHQSALTSKEAHNMGTQFFKAGGAPKVIGGGPQNMEARAMGSSVYTARGAAAGAQKDLGAASALNKGGHRGPMKRSAAYPKGPVT